MRIFLRIKNLSRYKSILGTIIIVYIVEYIQFSLEDVIKIQSLIKYFEYKDTHIKNQTSETSCNYEKIKYDNPYAMEYYNRTMTSTNIEEKFKCLEIPKNQSLINVDKIDNSDSHKLILNEVIIKKVFKHPDSITCYVEKFEKAKNKPENKNGISMSGKKEYFENGFVVVQDHGYNYFTK